MSAFNKVFEVLFETIGQMIISESHLLAELNSLRANPKNYAALLEARMRNYRGKVLYLPNQPPIVTREGVSAVQEALRVLRSTGPLPPLTASRGLSLAARAHVRDIGPKGLV